MIWRLTYCNKKGVEARIDIIKGNRTPVEVVQGSGQPFTLAYKLDKTDKSGHIMTSSADIEIFETDTFNIDDLKTSNETELKVEYFEDNVLTWEGFILPDFFSREIGSPNIVRMTASDRLTALKGLTLSDLPSKVSLRDLIELSLAQTGLSLGLVSQIQINQGSTNILDSEVLSQRLTDVRGRSISCYDILLSIMVGTNSTIRQRAGQWQVYNKLEHELRTPTIFFDKVERGAIRTIQPVASSVGVYNEFGGNKMYPQNYDFSNGLTWWTTVNGFNAGINNKEVTGYTMSGGDFFPIYGNNVETNSVINKNASLSTSSSPYLKSENVAISYPDNDSVDVTVEVNATGVGSYITNSFVEFAIIATNPVTSKILSLSNAGTFETMTNTPHIHRIKFPTVTSFYNASTGSLQVKGALIAGDENLGDYHIHVRIYGSGENRTSFINSATIKFSVGGDNPKGNLYKTTQGSNFTKQHDIETVIFGDYIRGGINGHFYYYPIDDTSNLYLPSGTLSPPQWITAFDTTERPLLHHISRQKSSLFSVAHDILKANINVESFDPLAVFQDCKGGKYVVVSANFDFLRSEVDVELEQIAYDNTILKRDYIYSYFGEGEDTIKSIGGIAGGGGTGGGGGGGMTNDQVAILNDVAKLAHLHENKEIIDQITQDMVDNASHEIVISTDTETELTDENILSALRVLSEITKNNETFLEDLKERFLSKIEPDTAQKLIKFVEGIEVGDFTTGALGAGAAVKMVDGTSYAEVDNLTVRQKATFRELIIESLKHIGGQLVLTPARMKCVRVVDGGSFYKCYFDTGYGEVTNEFVAGDYARCQVFTGSGTKFYWRLVTLVGEDWINISKTSAAVGSDAPEAGDDITQLGNATDTTRQSAIILSTVGIDAPSWKQYSGINSFSLEGKETTVFSKLGNRIQGKTVFTSGGADLDDYLDGVAQDILDALQAAQDAEDKAQQAIEDAEADVAIINTEIGRLQDQIDGKVSNWYYAYSPTLSNYPASDWTTNEIRDAHIGDTFTNTEPAPAENAGKSWRFIKDGSTYSWIVISDSDALKALLEASKAQATADGKSTTYLFQPTKYKLGDMWVLNDDHTINGTRYKQGDLLTATQDSETFVQAHWLKRVRYTDDTAINELEIGGRNLLPTSIWENGHILVGTGENSDVNRNERLRTFEFITIENSSHYTLSWDTNSLRTVIIYEFNSGKQWIRTNAGEYDWDKTPNPFTFQTHQYSSFLKVVVDSFGISNVSPSDFQALRVKLEKGNKATDWTPAPEDVQAEIDAAKKAGIDLGIEIDKAFSNLSITNIEANNLDLLRKNLAKEVADVVAIAASISVSVVDVNLKLTALNNILNSYTGKADSVYPITVTVEQRGAINTAFTNLEASLVALYDAIDNKKISNSITSFTNTVIKDVQEQIDGKIESHFTATDPATAWTTAALKIKHTGDMWYNTATKKLNRYSGSGWSLVEDQKAIDAFNTASTAKDTADGKRRVFTSTPTVPYDVGDLWAQGTSGDLMRCTTPKTSAQSYSASDWEKASKYTDDTAIDQLEIGGVNLLNGTSEDWKTTNIGQTWSYPYGGGTNSPMYSDVKEGTNYTFSVEVKGIPLRTKTYIRFFDINNQTISNHGSKEWTEANTESLLYVTGKAPEGAVSLVLAIAIESIAPNTTVYYRKGQLEEGSKRTSWGRSHNDILADITTAKTEAENAAKTYANTKAEAERVLAEAYADGIVSDEEQARIDDVNNKLALAKEYAEAQDTLLKTQQEAYADGKISDSEQAIIAAAEAYADLKKTEAQAYADGIVSDEEARAIADALDKYNASKAHAEQLVKDIEIGGRNLITGSYNDWRSRTINQYGSTSVIIPIQDDWRGKRVTHSFEVKDIPEGETVRIRIDLHRPDNTYTIHTFGSLVSLSGKSYVTYTVPADTQYIQIRMRIMPVNHTADYNVLFRCEKLEFGNKPTDWAPAPEDVEAEINTAKQEALTAAGNAQTAAGNAQTTANSLKNFTDTAFRDGIINRSESVAIEKYKNSLNETMAKTEASFMKVFMNTYLEGAAKTDLENAKINLWGQRDTLLSAINTAISGGTTTPAQKTAVDNAFNHSVTGFNKRMSEFQNALEEANKAIQTKLDDLSTEKINSIEIGGRNLISEVDIMSLGTTASKGIDDFGQYIRFSTANTGSPRFTHIKYQDNTQYTLSVEASVETGSILYWYFVYTDGSDSGMYATIRIDSATPVILRATSAINKTIDYIAYTWASSGYRRIYNIKLEKGNKATDWTPATEDTEREVLEAQGYMKARYVRDWLNGSSVNAANTWNEIKIVDKSGTNLALGKTATTNDDFRLPVESITDNDITTYSGTTFTSGVVTNTYIQIDLGQVHYDIDYIHVWHYYLDGRTYNGTKTQISEDGITWKTIFDSEISGTYAETEGGKVHTQRYASVMNRIAETEAKTRFQTLIDGGLIYTALMKLFDTISGDETAFISGKQGAGRNLPAFGAGGSYQDALAGTAKAIIRHDGTSKFSDTEITGTVNAESGKVGYLNIDAGGSLSLEDEEGETRLLITKEDITPIADIGESVQNTTVNNSQLGFQYMLTGGVANYVQGNKMGITNNNTLLTISTSIEITISTPSGFKLSQGRGRVAVRLKRIGFPDDNILLGETTIQVDKLSGEPSSASSGVITISKSMFVGAGTYEIAAEVWMEATAGDHSLYNLTGTLGDSTMVASFDGASRRTEIGKNGIGIIVNATNYSYIAGGTFEVRRGNSGLRITNSGIQKWNGTSWVAANI